MLDPDLKEPDLYSKAADLHSLLRCAMVAEENETSGVDWKGLDRVLEIAVRLSGEVMDGVDAMSVKGGDS